MPLFTSLDHTAQRLHEDADLLRRQAAIVAAASAATAWRSPAAAEFQRRSETTCRQLRACASDVERTADALRAHARQARAVGQVANAAAHLAEQAGSTLHRAVSSFLGLVS